MEIERKRRRTQVVVYPKQPPRSKVMTKLRTRGFLQWDSAAYTVVTHFLVPTRHFSSL